MKRAFISYSSRNEEFAKNNLVPFLKRKGVEPWFSKAEIAGGEHWQQEIREGLELCDFVILLVSKDAAASKWVRTEITLAQKMEKLVIPLLLDNTPKEEIHAQLVLVQHLDMRHRHNRRSVYQELAQVITTQQLPPLRSGSRNGGPSFKPWLLAGVVFAGALVIGIALWFGGSDDPVVSLDVVPQSLVLAIGQNSSINAFPRDKNGDVLLDAAVSWTSADASVASVDSKGLVEAHSSGKTTVSASCGGYSSYITVMVKKPDTVKYLKIGNVATGRPFRIMVGNKVQLDVQLSNKDQVAVPNRDVMWTVSDYNVVTITPNGLLEAHSTGDVRATARCDDARLSFEVVVEPRPRCQSIELGSVFSTLFVGESRRLSTILYDRNRRELTDRPVNWRSTEPSVASVGQDGSVQAIKVGSAEIVVSCEDAVTRMSITVVPKPPVSSVNILGAPSGSVAKGNSFQLKASVRLSNGEIATDRVIVWNSNKRPIAGVDRFGRVTAYAPGEATISAECEGKTDNVTIRVKVSVHSVQITTQYTTMYPEYRVKLSVKVSDASGNALVGRTVRWSVNDSSIAEIDPQGVLVTHSVGNVIVTAECEGVTGRYTMRIVPPMVHKMTLPLAIYELKIDGSIFAVQGLLGERVENPQNVRATTTRSENERFIWKVKVDGEIFGVSITEVFYVDSDGRIYAYIQDFFGNLTLSEVGTATFWEL